MLVTKGGILAPQAAPYQTIDPIAKVGSPLQLGVVEYAYLLLAFALWGLYGKENAFSWYLVCDSVNLVGLRPPNPMTAGRQHYLHTN